MLSKRYREAICERRRQARKPIPIDPKTGHPVGLNVCKFVIDLRCPDVPVDNILRWNGQPIQWGGEDITWGAP